MGRFFCLAADVRGEVMITLYPEKCDRIFQGNIRLKIRVFAYQSGFWMASKLLE